MGFNLVSTLRIFLGLIFVFSGIAKGIDFEWFTGIVRGFGILPDFLILPASVLILVLEFSFGLMLLFGVLVKLASLFLILMVLGFTVFLFFARINGYAGECGCFGRLIEREVDLLSLFENLVLVSGLIFVNLKTKRREKR